jgi:predicted NUDIX family NTP pyrophosphohydrolase
MAQSAGILLYRYRDGITEFFIVHPGGPFWRNKDAGAWSIPKGEFEEGEEPLKAAQREFEEETGVRVEGEFIELKPVRQRSGKIVHTWGLNADINAEAIRSNTFSLEWPPKSKKFIEVPEVDRAGWFSFEDAKVKLNPGQVPILEELNRLAAATR